MIPNIQNTLYSLNKASDLQCNMHLKCKWSEHYNSWSNSLVFTDWKTAKVLLHAWEVLNTFCEITGLFRVTASVPQRLLHAFDLILQVCTLDPMMHSIYFINGLIAMEYMAIKKIQQVHYKYGLSLSHTFFTLLLLGVLDPILVQQLSSHTRLIGTRFFISSNPSL